SAGGWNRGGAGGGTDGQAGGAFQPGAGGAGAGSFGGAGFGGGRMNGSGMGQESAAPLAEPVSLAVYTVLFAAAAGFGYRVYTRRRAARTQAGRGREAEGSLAQHSLTDNRRSRRSILWLILGSALLLRIAIAPWTLGHVGDTNYFRKWAASAALDFTGFYVNGSADYPPFLIYFLYLIGKAATLPGMDIFLNTMIKLPSLVADVLTGYLIYRLASKYVSFRFSVILAVLYICNPAVLVDSLFWGQVDSFFTLLIVLAVLLMTEGRLAWAAAVFAAAVMMKPQGIIFTPVLFFEWVRLRSVKHSLTGIAAAAVTAILLILPFSSGQEPLWIVKLFQSTIGEYPYASLNADNFFSLVGANHVDSSAAFILFSYHTWGFIFIVLTTAFSWLIYSKMRTREAAFLAALFQIAGVFTFSSSMHERYLFPAVALAFCAYVFFKDKRLLWLAAGLSFTVFANIFSVLYGATGRTGTPSYTYSMQLISLVNVVLVLWLAIIMWQLASRAQQSRQSQASSITQAAGK
ncbi:glycosyltransferase 87 family protein, partial [Paenibacillus pinistramenti]|uniref:glycosyltransferase 87 family protein n=1 Tax=Paenibacillus pinistramenti TaxID=1768003 RepID=UPI0013968FF9